MSEDRRALWDQRHAAADGVGAVAEVLQRHAALLPPAGRALDLACGRGADALWLAERGLTVSAWDYSAVAIDRLMAAAQTAGLVIDAEQRDVVARPPAADSFDLILVSHFLERSLCPAISAALRPGGLLCYQTFGPEVSGAGGPGNPAFRLQVNELLRLFPGLVLRVYTEPGALGRAGDLPIGEVCMIAQRPA